MSILEQVAGISEMAELWGLSESRIKSLCQNSEIEAKKIGKTWVINKNQCNPKKYNTGGRKVETKNDWEVIRSYVDEQLDDVETLELAQELFGTNHDNLVNVVAESYHEAITSERDVEKNIDVEYLDLYSYLNRLKEQESWV